MSDYEPVELNGFYRAGHSTIWELADASGVLAQLNMKLTSLEFTESSSKAEAALLDGRVDFVSGNHISPYKLVAQNKPIVCLASPGNQVRDVVVTRNQIDSIQDLRGKRIADTALEDLGERSIVTGNAERCVEQLKRVEEAGVEEVILYFNVGLFPHTDTMEMMERFTKEVLPAFS